MTVFRLRDRLSHILKAIAAIEDYTRGVDEETFIADFMIVDAVDATITRE